ASLTALGGFFKCYYSWGRAYLPDNPIHDLLSIESEVVPEEDVKQAYKTLRRIDRTSRKIRQGIKKISSQKKLRSVYEATRKLGIPYGVDSDLLTQSLKVGVLDCDTASFPALAIAHQNKWPVYLVHLPRHSFLRWDDGKRTRFNMDFGYSGTIKSREYYVKKFNIAKVAEEKGIHLKSSSREELISYFLTIRGTHRFNLGRFKDAVDDAEQALEYNPNNVLAFNNLNAAKNSLGRYGAVVKAHDKVIALDPHSSHSYANLGAALTNLGKNDDAIEALEKAVKLDPYNSRAYANLGGALINVGKIKDALEAFIKALELNPREVQVYSHLIHLELLQNNYDGAITYATMVIEELDPRNAEAYFRRALARVRRDTDKPFHDEKYKEVLKDLKKALELDPDDVEIKKVYEMVVQKIELEKRISENKEKIRENERRI
ncbi:tetratricopeptide repeat protein, partial [Candidatus Pacearchaeota archaeon]|nr:tetratricopeptide repeat protein [Candidatus Pacearchaeota archaeon]